MTDYNYEKIVKRLFEEQSDRLNDWESGFIENLHLNWDGEYTDSQKEHILKINRKVRSG